MSYEGYCEVICENGHKISVLDIYSFSVPSPCKVCGAKWKYESAVDETNGYDSKDPSTFPAPVEEIGFTDEWLKDHYGNEYAVKHMQYKPAPKSRWRDVSSWYKD